jgi:hypothetical protein
MRILYLKFQAGLGLTASAFVLASVSIAAPVPDTLEQCQAQLQVERAERIRDKAGEIARCRAYVGAQQCRSENQSGSETTNSLSRLEANKIARNAVSTIPFRSQGGGCPTCDSVNILDVPRDPRSNSDQGRWLSQLLKTQNDALFALLDTAGINLLRSEERDVCGRSNTCRALFRQGSIAAAADLLGDR